MNILFLINEFERGGAERVVSYLLQDLPQRFDDSKFWIFLLEKSEISYPLPDFVKIITGSAFHQTSQIKFFKLFLLALRLKKIVKKENIKTVISFLNRANYVNILSSLAGSPHRTIISERNTASIIYGKNTSMDLVNRFLIRTLYKKCAEIIAVSQGVKNDLVTNFNIPEKNIFVIYNPFDIDKIKEDADKPLDHPWVGNSRYKVMISVGRLEEQKNYTMLIRSFQRVSSQLPDARLIIIGEGKERPVLIRLIKNLALENRIDLIGQQDNPFMYLARADLFILSSVAEGFPNVLLESMICGCPVISTDCPSGPNEIITNGQNGILIPVGDTETMSKAMISLLEDQNKRSQFIENAYLRAIEFNLEKIGKQYAEFLMKKPQPNEPVKI
jgi:N-acetylgalactosamine-N,N'-diacetylbacillosaminyl-diphospho-undecaprenol 4-alpha-N-acetylgalactosaminyltransferase